MGGAYAPLRCPNIMSKIFESVTTDQVFTTDEIDKYQFGLKANHSTAMCTSVLDKLLIITETMAAMYLPVSLILLKLLIM